MGGVEAECLVLLPNTSDPEPDPSVNSARLLRSLAALAAVLSTVSCTQSIGPAAAPAVPAVAPPVSPAAAAPAAPPPCWSFSPRSAAAEPGWHAIRDGVAIAPADDGTTMVVTYHRDRGKPAGVAFELAPGSCARLGRVDLRLAAAAKQRLWVCLTDSRGVVWTFPTLQATATMTNFTLAAADVRPDPFQNGGKRVPAQPDWADMRLLTILDISGFMGAPAVDCSWRIDGLRGEQGER